MTTPIQPRAVIQVVEPGSPHAYSIGVVAKITYENGKPVAHCYVQRPNQGNRDFFEVAVEHCQWLGTAPKIFKAAFGEQNHGQQVPPRQPHGLPKPRPSNPTEAFAQQAGHEAVRTFDDLAEPKPEPVAAKPSDAPKTLNQLADEEIAAAQAQAAALPAAKRRGRPPKLRPVIPPEYSCKPHNK